MKFTLALSVFSLFSLFNANSFTSEKRNLMISTETDFETSSINRNYEQNEETKFQTINFLFFDSHSENVNVPIGQSVLDYLPENTQTVNDGFYSHIYTWLQIDTFSFKEDEKVISFSDGSYCRSWNGFMQQEPHPGCTLPSVCRNFRRP